MKLHINLIKVLMFIFPFLLSAQTVQHGIVKEYNEKAKKTPLAGVELYVKSAESTASDKQGKFALQFLTLKPGEKINVRRIEKLGYEIFNKEAIEQWNLNPTTPFVIVMCRSDKFKKIRDNYQRVASENYNKQYKKEQARLSKLKEEGKIKEAEYQKQLIELSEGFERQFDNLENYVDKFSRIDISELSATEQEIIALVQQGKFDEAIKKYEEQNYLEKYKQEVDDIKEISSAIDQLYDTKKAKGSTCDSLLAAIDRQIETLKLAGGKENFDKIGVILKEIYLADTTKYETSDKYADYLYETKQLTKALPLYCSILKIGGLELSKFLLILNRLSLIEKDFENIEKSLFYSSKANNLINDNPSYFSADERVGVLLNEGLIYHKRHEIDSAKYFFQKAIDLGDSIECSQLLLASVKNNLANIYSYEQQNDLALKLYKEIYTIYKQNNDDTPDSNESLSGVLLNITRIHSKQNKESIGFIEQAIAYITKSYEYNPRKYSIPYINVLNMAGNIYSDNLQDDLSEKYYNMAFNISKMKYDENPYQYWRIYLQQLGNIAILQTKRDHNKAIETFGTALNIVRNAPESNYRSKSLSETLYNLAYVYIISNNINAAIPLLEESLLQAEQLFSYNKRYGAMMYLRSLNNVAYCYDKINEYFKAKETYSKGIEIIEQLELTEIAPFNSEYADFIYNLGHHIHYKESLYSEAIQHYIKAYSVYENLRSDKDMLETSIGLSECYLKMNKIDKSLEWISKVKDSSQTDTHIGWWHTRGLVAIAMGDNVLVQKCRDKILAINQDIPIEEMELFNSINE